MVPKDMNQLLVADITSIRLVRDYAYLADVLDAFSRRSVSWSLSSCFDTKPNLAALTITLDHRTVTSGLAHHFDQIAWYASNQYLGLLESENITI